MIIPAFLSKFSEASPQYAMQPIMHDWPDDIQGMVEALKEYGCRGAVLNCPFKNGFTTNPDNLSFLRKVLDAMDAAGLKYWIYDEPGYPSGMAGGLTLKGHPEYEARGFYMRRHMAYDESKTVHFRLDDQSDKIVWAAKYKFSTPGKHETVIDYESMEAVPFTRDAADAELAPWEAFFVFCVKTSYEGSHCTHNVCSFRHYINIMDKAAVKHFLDIAYEPIKASVPEAFKRAEAVFTDEPSLQVGYARGYEMWPYALAPWVDGLFEAFERKFGFSLKPWLPLIFEGTSQAYPYRYKFYQLVGDLISQAWSGQIQAWCKDAGGVFSGHYLGEEGIGGHVRHYGSYLQVLKQAGYPGIDVLACIPEEFNYCTVKYPQMAARKMKANGMMVEICPFVNRERFMQAPLENMTGVMGMLFLGGTRKTNSYFMPDFSEWQNGRIARKGVVSMKETQWFNQYISRIGKLLDGLENQCNVFIYYALEEAQSKCRPEYTAAGIADCALDGDTPRIARAIYEAGHDFYYADAEDIIAAGAKPEISGFKVRTMIVPGADIIDEKVMKNLAAWQQSGVEVLFMDRLPRFSTEPGSDVAALNVPFKTVSQNEILETLARHTDEFQIECQNATVLHGQYQMMDGHELHMLVNKSRTEAKVVCRHPAATQAWQCNPCDGTIGDVSLTEPVTVPPLRVTFLIIK